MSRCRQCGNVLGKSKKIINQVEFLEDKVHAVALGELAFVISRRLILNILFSAFVLCFVIWRVTRIDPVMGTPVDTTWDRFREDCGNNVFRKTDRQAMNSLAGRCQYNHMGSTFQNWKAYVIKIHDNRSNYFDFFHSLKILVLSAEQLKTDPEDNPDAADLVLDVNFDKAKLLNSLLEKLDRGQGIVFNATLKNFHVSTPNHLHLVVSADEVDLQLTNDFREIPDVVVANSRYASESSKNKLFKQTAAASSESSPR